MLLNQYHLLRPVTQNKVSCQPWHFTLIYLSLSQLKERCMVHTQTTTTTTIQQQQQQQSNNNNPTTTIQQQQSNNNNNNNNPTTIQQQQQQQQQKKRKMTEASASVCPLLATALIGTVIRSIGDSLLILLLVSCCIVL